MLFEVGKIQDLNELTRILANVKDKSYCEQTDVKVANFKQCQDGFKPEAF